MGTSTSTSYTHSPATASVSYRYIVTATNGGGTSDASDPAIATPTAASVAPTTSPASISSTPGDNQVLLTWSSVTNATNYIIYRSIGSGANVSGTQIDVSSSLSYTDTSAANGQTYSYAVSGNNSVGTGPRSTESLSTPTGTVTTPTSAPASITSTPGDNQVTLVYGSVTGATDYIIYRLNGSGANLTGVQIANPSTLSHTDTSALNETLYSYAVSGNNTAGTGPRSVETLATPVAPSTPPASAPTNLVANAGNNQVSLSFDTVSGATDYFVYRLGTSGANVSGVQIATTSTTSYTDLTAANGTNYFYSVSGNNAAGEGPKADEDSATPNPSITTAAANLTGYAGDGNAVLGWETITEATDYIIYRKVSAGANVDGTILTFTSSNTHIDTTVSNDQEYYYAISGNNSASTGPRGDEVNVLPTANTPAKINNIVATASSNVITLSWDAVASANLYDIRFDTASPVDQTNTLAGNTMGNTFVHTGLNNGTEYFYKVYGFNHVGTTAGNSSDQVSATPNVIPTAPTNLVATGGTGNINLTWDTVTGADNYIVYKSSTASANTTGTAIATSTNTIYLDENLGIVQYFYMVSAQNTAGEGPGSNEDSATPTAAAPPLAPTITYVGSGTGNIELVWDAVANADDYTVYYETVTTRTDGVLTTSDNPTVVASGTLQDLSSLGSSTYFVGVRANGPGGSSNISTVVKKATGEWSPADMTTHMWLDASDNTTVTGSPSGNISQWNDKSGNNNHVVQSDSTKQPTLHQNEVNSKPAFRFLGTNQYFNAGGLSTGINEVSIFNIMKRTQYTHVENALIATDSTPGNWDSGDLQLLTTTSNREYFFPYDTRDGISTRTRVLGDWILSGMVHKNTGGAAGTISHFHNGEADGEIMLSLGGGGYNNMDLNDFNIGSWDATDSDTDIRLPLNADLSELIIIESAVTDAERMLLEGYLAHKWGLSGNLQSTHPAKIAAP